MVFSRWDAYKNTLESSTNFKRFFEWFDLMEDEERREKIERENTKYRSPILETVRRALSLFVGDRFTNPRIEIKPLRFVMDEIGENHQTRLNHIITTFSCVCQQKSTTKIQYFVVNFLCNIYI